MRVRFAVLHSSRSGEYDPSMNEICLNPEQHGRWLFHTLLHELGHWIVWKVFPPTEEERYNGDDDTQFFGRGLVRFILNDWVHRLDIWSGNKAMDKLLLELFQRQGKETVKHG